MQDLAELIARLERIEQFLGIDNQMSAQEARQLEAIKRDGIKALKYFNRVCVADDKQNGKVSAGLGTCEKMAAHSLAATNLDIK